MSLCCAVTRRLAELEVGAAVADMLADSPLKFGLPWRECCVHFSCCGGHPVAAVVMAGLVLLRGGAIVDNMSENEAQDSSS